MTTNDDDQRRIGWVTTVAALVVIAGFVAGKAARDAILLSNFGIKTLPVFVAVSALIAMPIIFVAGRLMTRFGPATKMIGIAINAETATKIGSVLMPKFDNRI